MNRKREEHKQKPKEQQETHKNNMKNKHNTTSRANKMPTEQMAHGEEWQREELGQGQDLEQGEETSITAMLCHLQLDVITIPQITINSLYKLFPNGWFLSVLPTSLTSYWMLHICILVRLKASTWHPELRELRASLLAGRLGIKNKRASGKRTHNPC